MRFFKKKEKWFKYKKIKPPLGIVVLFCDYYHYWIGKIVTMNISENKFIIFYQDENKLFSFSSTHSESLFWRYLPNQPERLNPEASKEEAIV